MESTVLPEEFSLKLTSPSVEGFLRLRKKVGWGELEANLAKKSLNNSLFHVTIYHDQQLIGLGRVVGDGAMFFYIQDVVVDPDYQNLGIGTVLMDTIEGFLRYTAQKGSTIGLLSAQGKESFYGRYGYMERPNNNLGHGMCKFV